MLLYMMIYILPDINAMPIFTFFVTLLNSDAQQSNYTSHHYNISV